MVGAIPDLRRGVGEWRRFLLQRKECDLLGSVVDPNRLCSDPDLGSHVHSDPDPNRIRINSNPDPDPT